MDNDKLKEKINLTMSNILADDIITKNIDSEENFKKLQGIIDGPTDVVKIYSLGSCDYLTREGKYFAILGYKGHFKTITGSLFDTTTNRCIIMGLVESVKLLKKPCNAMLVTSTKIGVSKMRRGKGINYDILKELFDVLEIKECEPEFVVVEGEGEKLNSFILSKVNKKESL